MTEVITVTTANAVGIPCKLRLPGHSRASTGGMGAVSGTRPDTACNRRASLPGGMQSNTMEKQQSPETSASGTGRQKSPQNPFAAETQQVAWPETPTGTTARQKQAFPAPTESTGHIRVAVRVRPLPEDGLGIIEVAGTNTVLIQKDATNGGNGFLSSQQSRIETRSFDRVFGPRATQEEIYEDSCAPLLTEAIVAARCATIFAYGATGAGKTHTMFGSPEVENQGIILRAIPDVFRAVAEYNRKADSSQPRLQVKTSFLEIYNETVRDLLQDGGGGGMCRVLEDERRGVVQVSNIVEPVVASAEEALAYLQAGTQSRTIEATAANLESSRSHAVFSLTVERVWQNTGKGMLQRRASRGAQEQRQLHSKICLIDLAGSERAAFSQNVGQALKDGARINQSLLALANCIDALIVQSRLSSTTPRKKPPYRDSKLTLMLKGSLMGDGLVAMIANVHPGRLHFEDSNNTLEYAKRASTVKASNRRLSRQSASTMDDEAPVAASLRDDNKHRDGAVREAVNAKLSAHVCRKSRIPSPELTTASSPEECLSEVSVSSGQDPAEDPEGFAMPASSAVTEDTPEDVGEDSPADFDVGLAVESEQPLQLNSPAEPNVSTWRDDQRSRPEHLVATELAAQLQKDNQRMSARLRLAIRERNSSLKDRQALEDENEWLRQESIEKDRQLSILLGRCELMDSAASL